MRPAVLFGFFAFLTPYVSLMQPGAPEPGCSHSHSASTTPAASLPPCSLCWSSIILLLLPYPLLAPLCPPVCCTLGHYHLVRLTGFGEGDSGGPSGGTPALKAPFCIDHPAVDLFVIIEHTCRCRRGRRLAQSISFFGLRF